MLRVLVEFVSSLKNGDKMNAKTMDMTTGPFLKKIIVFSLPIIFSSVLQLFFNAADIAIVGKLSSDGDFAVSAVGCSASLINAIISLAVGLSNGASVVVSQRIGARNDKEIKDAVHTAMSLSVICGVLLGVVGFILAKPLLILIGTPDEVLPLAQLYMRIYFAGLPVQMIYNFGSSILRAIGDTVRPLIYLALSGVLNVGLNIIFVSAFNMSVDGVALATVLSQGVSAVLVVIHMLRQDNACRLFFKELGIKAKMLKQILYVGIPAGLNGIIFSFSNTIMQSTINSFGPYAMAGSAAANSIAAFVLMPMNAIHHASSNFIGQNTGAKKLEQIKKLTKLMCGIVTVIGIIMSVIVVVLRRNLISIYTNSEEAIRFGVIHLLVVCIPYFVCGINDVIVGCTRGMGTAVAPMLVSLICICGFRLVWLLGFFPYIKTVVASVDIQYAILFLSYVLSWSIALIFQTFVYNNTYKKLKILFA